MNRLIEALRLKSGAQGSSTPLEFQAATVNVFVGPNHSGKSLLLREMQTAIQHPDRAPSWKVLDKFEFGILDPSAKNGLARRLREDAKPDPSNPNHVQMSRGGKGWTIPVHLFEAAALDLPEFRDLPADEWLRDYLMSDIFLMLGGMERLSILQAAARGNLLVPSLHVLGKLFQNDMKRSVVQKIVRNAFGSTLVIDAFGESSLEVKLSESQPASGIERSLSEEAGNFFRAAVDINEMSDGIKAFSGMVAAVVAHDARLILIDEPEAFLHPQLCATLARELCGQARKSNQQLFIATHSAAFLMGCVQAGLDLNIVRVTYRKHVATSRVLAQQQLVPLMRQPLLRSVGALAGIFQEAVVVTESASDRAFYDEINHRCVVAEHRGGIPECLFLNAQNWQTTARIIAPLRRLGIPAAAIVDLDILRDSAGSSFQTLMEAAHMPPGTRTSLGQLRGALHKQITASGANVKKLGLDAFTGDGRRDANNFVDNLATYGIFVVPVGELERWLPNLKRHDYNEKNGWLLRTFEAMGEDPDEHHYVRPGTGDVWDFLIKLEHWLHNPARLGIPT